MSFADGWPRCQKILEMILCRVILSLAHCDLFAAMHILLQRSIALVNPVQLGHTCTCRSGLTIFILDEDSQGKGIGPGRWFAAQTMASNGRHGACHCESSPGFPPTNWIQSLFLSWRKDGATVICSCVGRYHTTPTIQLKRRKRKRRAVKDAQDAKWRCKKVSACSLPGDADDAIRIYCKTI